MALGFAALLGIVGLALGQWISGGSVVELLQPVSLGMILVGTFSGVLISFPKGEARTGFRQLFSALQDNSSGMALLQEEVSSVASTARKEGFLALDALRGSLKTPGLKEGVKFLMDGFDGSQIGELYDAQIRVAKERMLLPSRIWEAAGAYAPTMGVIVAALGLMRVMTSLEDVSKLGQGISVAFVSLIYGILLSNLFFLPFANRIRRNAENLGLPFEMVKAAILGIQEGVNPGLIDERMRRMLPGGSE